MSRYYPEEKKLRPRDVEFYVQGMWDLYLALGGDGYGKMYDPLTIEGKTAHSYVMDLNDGGRHHPFDTLEELADDCLEDIKGQTMEIFNPPDYFIKESVKSERHQLHTKIKEVIEGLPKFRKKFDTDDCCRPEHHDVVKLSDLQTAIEEVFSPCDHQNYEHECIRNAFGYEEYEKCCGCGKVLIDKIMEERDV